MSKIKLCAGSSRILQTTLQDPHFGRSDVLLDAYKLSVDKADWMSWCLIISLAFGYQIYTTVTSLPYRSFVALPILLGLVA
jgi:hypothetical protein